ncbi:MAG: Anti sigma-E protein RseA family protein [Variovorax sp.]|nr:Anti sigma-E protein RseA family protein [Variovorax sp.]
MKQTMTMCEQVSALADGQLDDAELARLLAAASHDGEVSAAWHRYHLVGDVLRAGRHERCTDTSAFVSRLQQRLGAERSAMAMASPPAIPDRAPVVGRSAMEPANEPVFRWKLVAGAASLAAVAAIAWNWIGSDPSASAGAQLAQARGPAAVLAVSALPPPPSPSVSTATASPESDPGQAQAMLRDARLDEMLAAHQQASGGSQMPSVFLRNATFEGPSR